MRAKKNGNKGFLRLYRSYNYVDKDPAIDKLRTAMQDEGLDAKRLSLLSNVGYSTISNWMDGKTERPQHMTLAAAAASMGFEWQLSRPKSTKMDYDAETVKAERWHKQQEARR